VNDATHRMPRKRPHAITRGETHGAERGLDRLEGFSDAVFAIALTLLIVEIKVPGSPEGPRGYDDLAAAMVEQWREYLALVLCYIVIGAYWLQHHYSGGSGRIRGAARRSGHRAAVRSLLPAARAQAALQAGRGAERGGKIEGVSPWRTAVHARNAR
jgi:hypothetical protein